MKHTAIITALLLLLGISLFFNIASLRSSPMLLFVQTGIEGSFVPSNQGDSELMLLTLQGVPNALTYFSDRPWRLAGTLETQEFISAVIDEGSDPPNAALVLQNPESETQDVVIIELLSGTYQHDSNTMTYSVRLLFDTPRNLSQWANRRDDLLPRDFGDVSLFIDGSSCQSTQSLACHHGTF